MRQAADASLVDTIGADRRDFAHASRSARVYTGNRPNRLKVGPPPTQASFISVFTAIGSPSPFRYSAASERLMNCRAGGAALASVSASVALKLTSSDIVFPFAAPDGSGLMQQ